MEIAVLNFRFANLGLGLEIRKHAGSHLFFIVSTRDGGETILNSAMSLAWVKEWASDRMRYFFRAFVRDGRAFYPATGADPIFHY